MRVGIYKSHVRKGRGDLDPYYEILAYNGIKCVTLDASREDFWNVVAELDLFLFKWAHIDDHHQLAKTLIPIVEEQMGVKCFPNMATCWHYDDKIRQHYLLSRHGFPVIPTWIFWDRESALEWLEDADFPLVFKLKSGAGSNNIILVKDKRKAASHVRRMFGPGIRDGGIGGWNNLRLTDFSLRKEARALAIRIRNLLESRDPSPIWTRQKNYVMFQQFLSGNSYDTRVTTAGSRVHAFRRYVRDGDFRASGGHRWALDREIIDSEMLDIALEVSRKLGFQAMAYDFIYDQAHRPCIVEMSYRYGMAGYPDFMNGYWDENLDWHEGRYWPQYFELMDALELPTLRQPEMAIPARYLSGIH